MADSAALFGGGPEGLEAAYLALDGQVQLQALVMSFNDIYLALATAAVLALPMLLFLRRPPEGGRGWERCIDRRRGQPAQPGAPRGGAGGADYPPDRRCRVAGGAG